MFAILGTPESEVNGNQSFFFLLTKISVSLEPCFHDPGGGLVPDRPWMALVVNVAC